MRLRVRVRVRVRVLTAIITTAIITTTTATAFTTTTTATTTIIHVWIAVVRGHVDCEPVKCGGDSERIVRPLALLQHPW